tara:strand:+ start:128 stop:478 length:351 start_codon:yes stop_codon:yes gene_type:complete
MNKYIILGRTSSEYSSAMLSTPQDRRKVVESFAESLGIEIREFLYTSGDETNFFSVGMAESDERIEALRIIVYATGNFTNLSWSRAFEADEYKDICELGQKKMETYVTAMQVAGMK